MKPEAGEEKVSAAKIVRQEYLRSTRMLQASLPAESVSLYEASKGRLTVKLHSGEVHVMDEGEVRKLLEVVPPYFWKLVKIPVLLRYEKPGGGPSQYTVMGDSWQRRLVEIMLIGDFSESGLDALTVSDFKKIASKYPSLIFVSISL